MCDKGPLYRAVFRGRNMEALDYKVIVMLKRRASKTAYLYYPYYDQAMQTVWDMCHTEITLYHTDSTETFFETHLDELWREHCVRHNADYMFDWIKRHTIAKKDQYHVSIRRTTTDWNQLFNKKMHNIWLRESIRFWCRCAHQRCTFHPRHVLLTLKEMLMQSEAHTLPVQPSRHMRTTLYKPRAKKKTGKNHCQAQNDDDPWSNMWKLVLTRLQEERDKYIARTKRPWFASCTTYHNICNLGFCNIRILFCE